MALDLVARLDWLSALAAFAATTLALWLLTPLAPKLRLLDYPGGRKNHPMPTPVTGGVAMVAGVVAAAVGSPVVGDGFWGFVAAAAVLIAAAAVPKEIAARQRASLVQALDIANGGSDKVGAA